MHCAAIGHPIVGDPIYGLQGAASDVTPFRNKSQNDGEGLLPSVHADIVAKYNVSLCLHAKQLFMCHPIMNTPMVFECDPAF